MSLNKKFWEVQEPFFKRVPGRRSQKLLADLGTIKSWRETYIQETYIQMGLDREKYIPTVETMVRRVIRGHALPVINTAVNAYQAAALLTMLPIKGFDLRKFNCYHPGQ